MCNNDICNNHSMDIKGINEKISLFLLYMIGKNENIFS